MANEKRLIDANALVDKLEGLKSVLYGWEDYNTGIDSAVYQAENAPTVDAVEVVRCKDCKFAYINDFAKVQEKALCNHWRNHDGNSVLLEADDFCSYGERKDNER